MQPPKRTFSLRGPAGSSSTRAAAADGATDDDDESALSRAAADGALRFRDFALGMVVRVVVERGRRKGAPLLRSSTEESSGCWIEATAPAPRVIPRSMIN